MLLILSNLILSNLYHFFIQVLMSLIMEYYLNFIKGD